MVRLYYLIKKAHVQSLPPKMRELGDRFVKQEFRAHLQNNEPKYMQGFVEKWIEYYQQLSQIKDPKDMGRDLDPQTLQSRFTAEQREALEKIRAGLK